MSQAPTESGVETEGVGEGGAGNVPRDPSAQMMNASESDTSTPTGSTDAGVDLEPDAAPTVSCPAGATLGPNDRCYATVSTALIWADARIQCQSIGTGWALADIQDATENDFVAALMSDEAWLGGSDAALEGDWIWNGDDEPFWRGSGATGAAFNGAFENWNSDEPNGGGPSDCLRLVAGIGTWADLQCTFERPAVCEGPTL